MRSRTSHSSPLFLFHVALTKQTIGLFLLLFGAFGLAKSPNHQITGREYSAASPISQLVENETDLVKKLELLISLEMTAIVVNGYTVKDASRHPWIVALRTNGKKK